MDKWQNPWIIVSMKIGLGICITILMGILGSQVSAHNYKYSDLIIRDYDEMSQQVKARIKKAKSFTKMTEDGSDDEEALNELKDALKLIFSRPNSDNMVAKLTPEVRRELSVYSAFEKTIAQLVSGAIEVSKNRQATVSQRSTSLFILENILSEIRPEAETNAELRKIIESIADAKLTIDEDVNKDRRIRSMFKTINPSTVAKEILKSIANAEKKSIK